MSSLRYDVPFFANTEGGTHCFQACLKMVLKYFEPTREFSWDELDIISAKHPGKWTWSMAGLLWLQDNGYDVTNIENFEYDEFSKAPVPYMTKMWGNEVAESAVIHTVISDEVEIAKQFDARVDTVYRVPSIKDIREQLEEGKLIICNVNSNILYGQTGWTGHFVVIVGYDEKSLIVHDPGRAPGQANRELSYQQFEKAWAYPDENGKNLMAIRPKI